MVAVSAPTLIVAMSNGHLECRHSQHSGQSTYWCQHISEYISQGLDARDIWNETDDNKLSMEGVKIQVPYVPTLGQWALVQVGAEHHGNYKIYLLLDSEKVDIRTGELPNEFLGFFSPGEGRMVLRTIVHNWFLPRLDIELQCKFSSHDYKAQITWERHLKEGKDSKEYLAQYWCLTMRGICLSCAKISDAVEGDDLIPEVAPPRSPWETARRRR